MVSDSLGLVDFAIGLVIFVPRRKSAVLGGNSNYGRIVINRFLGLVEMTCGLVHASYSLPESQAVKLTFFAHCNVTAQWTFCIQQLLSAKKYLQGSHYEN